MARKKKEKPAPEGAPEWMVTYGDMMTLLLCFFVMIVAMSEIKKEDKFQKVVESIRKQFGYESGIGIAPTNNPPEVAPTRREQATADENKDLTKGLSNEEAEVGDHELVVRLDPGQRYTVGTPIFFEPGSAVLRPKAYDPLMRIAEKIRGLEHRVEIRGHTSAAPLPNGSAYHDHMQLAMARAFAVRKWMIGKAVDRGRIDPRRVRVEAVGKYEPLKPRAYEKPQWALNDRVDIILDEALTADFEQEQIMDNMLTHRGESPLGATHAAGE